MHLLTSLISPIGDRIKGVDLYQPIIQCTTNQCDQIGRFLQVFGNKLSDKSSPNILLTC